MRLSPLVLVILFAVPAVACQGEESGASRCSTSLVAQDRLGESVELTEGAGAYGLPGRRGYSVWVGDYAVPTEAAGGLVDPPTGKHVLVLFIATGGPAATVGTVFSTGSDFPTLTLYAETSGGTFGFRAPGEAGTARVLTVDDDRICLEVDYQSSMLTVSGTVDAPVID